MFSVYFPSVATPVVQRRLIDACGQLELLRPGKDDLLRLLDDPVRRIARLHLEFERIHPPGRPGVPGARRVEDPD